MLKSGNIDTIDEQAILNLAREFDRVWNNHDAQRFSTFFTDDGDMHFITMKMHMRSKDEVAKTYTKIFSGMPPELIHRSAVKSIQMIADDIMLLDAVTDIIGKNAQGQETVLRRHTGVTVLKREEGGWRIRAMRIWTEQLQ